MSEENTPTPGDESPFTPPPPPPPPGLIVPTDAVILPAAPMPPVPPPAQVYPGAAPSYAPPGQTMYGTPSPHGPQPGYAPPLVQPGHGAAPVQPGYPVYGAPVYPAVAPRPTSGLAITSLICGIAGLLLVWALVPVLASIAAVITGHIALGQIKGDPRIGGKGLAITGLVLGYVAVGIGAFTVISTVLSFLFVGAFSLPFLLSS